MNYSWYKLNNNTLTRSVTGEPIAISDREVMSFMNFILSLGRS